MTPDELHAYGTVMRDLGIFRVALPSGVTIELSQHAIQAGQAEAMARAAKEEAAAKVALALAQGETGTTEPAPPPGDEEEEWAYAATEGAPADG